jgi:hypothetical protein
MSSLIMVYIILVGAQPGKLPFAAPVVAGFFFDDVFWLVSEPVLMGRLLFLQFSSECPTLVHLSQPILYVALTAPYFLLEVVIWPTIRKSSLKLNIAS